MPNVEIQEICRLRAAVDELLKLRVGNLPARGWLPDNDLSRKALQEMSDAALALNEAHGPAKRSEPVQYEDVDQ